MTVFIIAAVVLVVLALVLFGARKPTPRRARLAERGDVLGADTGEELLGAKIADDVDVPLAFRYRNASGGASSRVVMIDGVYGPSLDCPTHVRGLDSVAREPRAFRVDRMEAITTDGGEITEEIGWWIGNLVRHKLGLDLSRQPYQTACDLPVRLEVDVSGKPRAWFRGTLVEARRRYGADGPTIEFRFEGLAEDGPRRQRSFGVVWAGEGLNRIVTACDPETGEVIDDLEARALASATV